MELGDRDLPLTRAQQEIWLAQKTGLFGTRWQLGEFTRIAGPIDPDLFEWAIQQTVREAEPLRAAFFEGNDTVVQRVIDDPQVELERFCLLDSD